MRQALVANAFVSVYEDLNAATPTRPHSEIITAPGVRADWVLDNAVDSRGNIYVVGFTTGNLGGAPAGEGDAYVAKFSPQLTNPTYVQLGTAQCDVLRKLEMRNDTLCAVGYTYGDYIGMNADASNRTADVFIQKLDTNLNLLQATQWGTPHEERGLSALQGDYLFVGGMTEGALVGPHQGSFDAYILALRQQDLSIASSVVLTTSTPVANNQWKCYPNPTQDQLQLEWTTQPTVLIHIQLSNQWGQIVHYETTQARQVQLDLASLPAGSYWLTVQEEGRHQSRLIIKQ